MAPTGEEAFEEADESNTDMRCFYQFGTEKSHFFTSVLLLLLYKHFSAQNHNQRQAGSTCLDTGKRDLKYGRLKYQIIEASCKNRAGSLLDGSGYCVPKISQLFVQGFSRILKLTAAIILLLHAER